MTTQGIRGATQVPEDTPEAILAATRELLLALAERNGFYPHEVASIFFTATADLVSVHPALAARQLGWVEVPLLCAQEIDVPNSLPRVVRVLIHWNTERPQKEISHVYLGNAVALRPDIHSPAQPASNGNPSSPHSSPSSL